VSRVDDLIAELCPEGVEWKPVKKIGDWYGGGTPSKTRLDYWQNGTIPWLSPKDMGRHFIKDTEDHITLEAIEGSATKLVPANSVAVVVRSSILESVLPTALVPFQVTLNQDMKAVVADDCILPAFIAHMLRSKGKEILLTARKKGGSVSSIDMQKFMAFPVPVPPLPVQKEIVRILDSFTALEAELEAELEARHRQYEYYRDALLTFGPEVERKRLGEIFEMKAGKSISSSDISSVTNDIYNFPCFGGNGLRGYVKQSNQNGNVIILGRQGALCGNVIRTSGDFYATEHAVVVKAKPYVIIDWAFHMLRAMNLNQYATKSAQPGLSVGKIKTLTIPLPPLAEQERIVAILDRFEALVNDISRGSQRSLPRAGSSTSTTGINC
jgi:type I restriction enzyme S subunit